MNFSIIVPIYNSELLLQRCLDSIYAQTYQNFEIVAVDDGSTDASYEILRKNSMLHPQLRIVHFDKNEGLAINRKRGIAAANYDYIIFIDSDDTINPKLIECLTNILSVQHYDLIRYRVCLIDDQPGKNHERFNYLFYNEPMSGIEALKKWSIPGNKYALFWLYCFHKSLFNKFEIPNFRYNEDMCSVPFLILHSKTVLNIEYIGYNYTHTNPASMTNDRSIEAMNFKSRIFFDAYDFIVNGFKNFEGIDLETKRFYINDFKKSLTKKYNSFSNELKNKFKEMYEERINEAF